MPNNRCGLAGESMKHMEAKKWFFDLYKNDGRYRTVEMERRLWNDERIGDVVLYPKNVETMPTVIEIQNSPISVDEIDERFNDWNIAGHHMLWVLTNDVIDMFVDDEQRIPMWVRHLHLIYMGRVYVYSNNNIYTVHLDKVSRYTDDGYEYYLKATKIASNKVVSSKNILQTESIDKYTNKRYFISRFYDKRFW